MPNKHLKQNPTGLGCKWAEDVDITGEVSINGENGINVDLTEAHVKIMHIKIVEGIVTELETE